MMKDILTASEIDSWAKTDPRRAQEILPELIIRLILCTSSKINSYNFPIEKAIQYSGYDGVLDSDESTSYFPKGKSVWEFGTDENSIEEYLKIKNDIDATNKNTTTSTSIFGKNTVKRLKNKNNSFLIDPDILASDIIYLDDKMAITVLVKTAQNKLQTILAFPLLKQYQSQGLDIALLHELIHISEIKLESMHNPLFSKKEYIPFNEFRTQEKAITLFTKLREDNIHIFDQDDNDDTIYKSYYDEFIYLIEPLLDKYRELIDYCAINNRLSPLYKTLGRDKFDECCNSLSKLFSVSILVDEKLNEMKTYSKHKTKMHLSE